MRDIKTVKFKIEQYHILKFKQIITLCRYII